MEIVYKKLTEAELETFIDLRICQLTEEYENAGKEIPKNVDLKPALFDYYHKHMADGTFVSWLAMDILVVQTIRHEGVGVLSRKQYSCSRKSVLGLWAG